MRNPIIRASAFISFHFVCSHSLHTIPRMWFIFHLFYSFLLAALLSTTDDVHRVTLYLYIYIYALSYHSKRMDDRRHRPVSPYRGKGQNSRNFLYKGNKSHTHTCRLARYKRLVSVLYIYPTRMMETRKFFFFLIE